MSTVNDQLPTTSTSATDLASYQQFALEQQAQNNAWSAAQAQKQMDFQREMSNTAHQREVNDLKAAGLNPILSVNSGASVPNGAAGDTDTSAAGNVGAILQQVLQAQSAREVAGMYNAATLAAASIAANASMYGSDMSYWNTEDHPSNIAQVVARGMVEALNGNHAPGTGSSPHDNVSKPSPAVSAANSLIKGSGVFGSRNNIFAKIHNLIRGANVIKVNGQHYPNLKGYFNQKGWNYNSLTDMQQRQLSIAYIGFLKGNPQQFYRLLRAYKVTK